MTDLSPYETTQALLPDLPAGPGAPDIESPAGLATGLASRLCRGACAGLCLVLASLHTPGSEGVPAAVAASVAAKVAADAASEMAADAAPSRDSAESDEPGVASDAECGVSEYEFKSFNIPAGETVSGDRYFFGGGTQIDGTLDGDLFAFSSAGNAINGVVTGDVNFFSSDLTLTGEARDDVRVMAGVVSVRGVIHGDLMALAGKLDVSESGAVAGRTSAAGGEISLKGDFKRQVKAAGGKVFFGGRVAGDLDVEADVFELDPQARIGGNLTYTSREEIKGLREGGALRSIVGGDVVFVPQAPKSESSSKSAFSWLLWCWSFVAALLVGFLLIALARRPVAAILNAAEKETLRSLGFGVLGHIFAPFAGLILIVLCITLPAGVLVLAAWSVLFYLAKLVVSASLAHGVLRRLGRSPSPYLALFLGMIPLWILFEIPVLGDLLYWFIVPIIGIGATLIGLRAYSRGSTPPSGQSFDALPESLPPVAPAGQAG